MDWVAMNNITTTATACIDRGNNWTDRKCKQLDTLKDHSGAIKVYRSVKGHILCVWMQKHWYYNNNVRSLKPTTSMCLLVGWLGLAWLWWWWLGGFGELVMDNSVNSEWTSIEQHYSHWMLSIYRSIIFINIWCC